MANALRRYDDAERFVVEAVWAELRPVLERRDTIRLVSLGRTTPILTAVGAAHMALGIWGEIANRVCEKPSFGTLRRFENRKRQLLPRSTGGPPSARELIFAHPSGLGRLRSPHPSIMLLVDGAESRPPTCSALLQPQPG